MDEIPDEKGMPWLEIVLGISIVSLALQFFPQQVGMAWDYVRYAMDYSNWSRTAWFVANVSFVTCLVLVRFGPEMKASWKLRQAKIAKKKEKENKKRELQEQREMLERLAKGKSRRMY